MFVYSYIYVYFHFACVVVCVFVCARMHIRIYIYTVSFVGVCHVFDYAHMPTYTLYCSCSCLAHCPFVCVCVFAIVVERVDAVLLTCSLTVLLCVCSIGCMLSC